MNMSELSHETVEKVKNNTAAVISPEFMRDIANELEERNYRVLEYRMNVGNNISALNGILTGDKLKESAENLAIIIKYFDDLPDSDKEELINNIKTFSESREEVVNHKRNTVFLISGTQSTPDGIDAIYKPIK